MINECGEQTAMEEHHVKFTTGDGSGSIRDYIKDDYIPL